MVEAENTTGMTLEEIRPGVSFDYQNDNAVIRGADHLIYYCWSSVKSPDVQIGTTSQLSQDIISDIVFHNVTKASEKNSVEYSNLANQYALTRDRYNYWANLKKTTEQLGTIFDAQPSQLNSNIHCLGNPSEPVLGYLCASSTSKKRIFSTEHTFHIIITHHTGFPVSLTRMS